MTALAALIERIEQAKGPDHSIDCWIENLLGLARFVPERPAPFGEGWLDKRVEPKPFTASLDAALTLVPEGWLIALEIFPGDSAEVVLRDDRVNPVRLPDALATAATPALALAAAALKARQS